MSTQVRAASRSLVHQIQPSVVSCDKYAPQKHKRRIPQFSTVRHAFRVATGCVTFLCGLLHSSRFIRTTNQGHWRCTNTAATSRKAMQCPEIKIQSIVCVMPVTDSQDNQRGLTKARKKRNTCENCEKYEQHERDCTPALVHIANTSNIVNNNNEPLQAPSRRAHAPLVSPLQGRCERCTWSFFQSHHLIMNTNQINAGISDALLSSNWTRKLNMHSRMQWSANQNDGLARTDHTESDRFLNITRHFAAQSRAHVN